MESEFRKYDHSSAIDKIVEEFSLDKKRVKKTLTVFFGGMGMKLHLKKKSAVRFTNSFAIGPNKKAEKQRRKDQKAYRQTQIIFTRKYVRAKRQLLRLERNYYNYDNLFRIYRDS